MKATEIDMTHGSLWDKIVRFALPLALTVFLQQFYNAADVAVVGRFVGTEAMAAVGTNVSLIGLLVNLFMGISLGANVMVARYIGAQAFEKASSGISASSELEMEVVEASGSLPVVAKVVATSSRSPMVMVPLISGI